jgi:ABC-type nickel/cobalt efflux system permease component RcnA
VVAAYLVGTRGTVWHALLLGLIVTATHTAGVYVLGAVTLYASHYVIPERLYPWFGVLSGLAIAGLGGWVCGATLDKCRRIPIPMNMRMPLGPHTPTRPRQRLRLPMPRVTRVTRRTGITTTRRARPSPAAHY